MSKSKKPTTPGKKSKSQTATPKGLKEALAVTGANIARIETTERGEKPTSDGAAKPAKGNKPAAKAPKAQKPKKEKRMSGLDAAAKVLTESKDPMNATAIVEAMSKKGYWTSPGGKTPHATIYAAMVREIKEKGREARFVKKERGLFAAGKGA